MRQRQRGTTLPKHCPIIAGLLHWSMETKGKWSEIDCAGIKETIFQQIIEGGRDWRGKPNFDALDFGCQVKPNQQTPQTPEKIPSDSQHMISVRSVTHGGYAIMQALRAGYVQHGLLQFTNQCPWLSRLRELWEQTGLSEQCWTGGLGLVFVFCIRWFDNVGQWLGIHPHKLIKYDRFSVSPIP